MPFSVKQQLSHLKPNLDAQGFAFIEAEQMRALLLEVGSLDDWAEFADSWNDLKTDSYMADQGRYRKRRYAVYGADGDAQVIRAEHQPHYQGVDYNRLNGGVERWFEPIAKSAGESKSMGTVLDYARRCFGERAPHTRRWHIEVHQFRIEAQTGQPGLPTPEGKHRDGVDFVLVLMIARHNIASGTTSIHSLEGAELGAFTLTKPFDAALVDDHRVFHGVTAVEAVDPEQPSFRDVLVVTFRGSRDRVRLALQPQPRPDEAVVTGKVDSQWRKDFTEEQRQKWTHRLGNLVLMPRYPRSDAHQR